MIFRSFIISLVISITAIAQEPYVIKYNKAIGLPSNNVYNVFQDSKGFIWYGTSEGLTRHDGIEFKTYYSKKQTSTAGSTVKEDNYGRIWYQNFDGYHYYIANDSLYDLNQNKPLQYLPLTFTNKYLFVYQENGVDIYDLKSLKLIYKKLLQFKRVEFTTCSDKNFYSIIDNTIIKINSEFQLDSSLFFKKMNLDLKQIYYHNGKLYVCERLNENKKVYVFNEDLKFLYTILIDAPEFIHGLNFYDNSVWISTPHGVYTYPLSNDNKHFQKHFFKDKSISTVIKDRQSNYWFSTTNEGVLLAPDLNSSIFSYPNLSLTKIIEAKNSYIISTKKGELCLFDTSLNFKSFINQNQDVTDIYYLAYDSIKKDLFYSSTGFYHLPSINYQNHKHFKPAIKEIVKLDSNYFAVAASSFCGLASFNNALAINSEWYKPYLINSDKNLPNFSFLMNNVRGKSVAYNKATREIYFATNIGLYKYSKNKIIEIKNENETIYASKIIYQNNTLYILTSKGNLLFSKNETNFKPLNTKVNLKTNDIKFIKIFGSKLTIMTSRLCYLIDLDSSKLTKFNVDINFYEVTDVLVKDLYLLFITNSGIIKAPITYNESLEREAIFEITELAINGKRTSTNNLKVLKYNENSITIGFAILDFGASDNNSVYYRINGEEWKTPSGKLNALNFAALKPGNYSIEFKLNDKIVQQKITFIIEPPFWLSFWFIFLSVLIFIVLFLLFFRWQIIKLRNKNLLLEEKNTLLNEKIKIEKELNKSVLTSIKAQMNPHFFYNALNTIQAYIFTNDKSNASNYLAKFSKLTRIILEQSEKELITLQHEIESLSLYLELEKMRFKEGFDYKIDKLVIKHPDSIEFPPMLIQPYVENAVKHGLLHKANDKKLSIVFEEKDNFILVIIDDNGIGRKRSAELNKIKEFKAKSFSSDANEKRLEILNAKNTKAVVKIIDKLNFDGTANGTQVILTIPIK